MRRVSLLLALCSLLSAAFAVTYRVDPANGPETLSTEVKEAFAAWVALSNKVEATETEETPEAVFQYGASERFGSDTLSLTVQRQQEGRTLSFLISPNADNRKRVLLHETGIAIGLTPQIPGTPLPAAPTTPTTPPEGTPPEGTSPESTPPESTPTEGTPPADGTPSESPSEPPVFETTPLPDTPTSGSTEPSSEPTTQAGPSESTPDSTTPQPSDQATSDQATPEQSTSTEPTTESTEPTTDSSATPTPEQPTTEQPSTEQSTTESTTPESTTSETPPAESPAPPEVVGDTIMNPSIDADDSTELGEAEKTLLDRLQIFARQDISRDGVVNFYDLVALSQAFGRRDVNDPADLNRDGVVDQADVDELRKVYTFSDPAQTAPGSSPETPTEGTPDGTTPPEGTSTTPEQTPSDGTPPENLPPPQENGTLPSDGSGE
jgi:hypothetical protein